MCSRPDGRCRVWVKAASCRVHDHERTLQQNHCGCLAAATLSWLRSSTDCICLPHHARRALCQPLGKPVAGSAAQGVIVSKVQVTLTAGVGVPPRRLAEVVFKQAQRAHLAAGGAAVDRGRHVHIDGVVWAVRADLQAEVMLR